MCLRGWILSVAVFFSLIQVSFGQSDNWAVVSQLMPGQKIKVVTADGKSHAGKVEAVSESALQIGKGESIQKADVQKVLLWSPGHHGRNALIGLGVGAGFGIAAGASCGKDAIVSSGQCMAVGAPFFGGIGAGIGALLPSSGKWREVYRSK